MASPAISFPPIVSSLSLSPPPSSVSTTLSIIHSLLFSDNNQLRSQAEQAFTQLKTNDFNLYITILTLVTFSPPFLPSISVDMKEFCLVMLRQIANKSNSSFLSASPNVQQLVKYNYIQLLKEEENNRLRKKLIENIGGMCAIVMENNEWPELMKEFIQIANNPQLTPIKKETVLDLINKLGEYVDFTLLRPHLPLFKRLIVEGLQSSVGSSIRLAALRAVISLLIGMEEEKDRKAFEDCIPLIFGSLSHFCSVPSPDDEIIVSVIEVLIHLVSNQPKFLRPHIQPIIDLMIHLVGNKQLEGGTRRVAIEFLITLAEKGKGMIRKQGEYGKKIIPLVFAMLLEIDYEQEWEKLNDNNNNSNSNSLVSAEDEDIDDGYDNYKFGCECIERLAMVLGGNLFLPIASPLIQQCIVSPDWKQRNAGIMVINKMNEGVYEALREQEQVENIIKMVVPYTSRDPHVRVRYAAIDCLANLAMENEEIQSAHHDLLVPAFISAMNPACNPPRICARAAMGIVDFVQGGEDDYISPYLESFLHSCVSLLQSNHMKVQQSVLSSLSGTCLIVEDKFIPYFPSLFPGIREIIWNATAPQQRELRGRAIESAGAMAEAVGKELFQPFFLPLIEKLISVQKNELTDDDPLTSYIAQTQARIAKCMGEQFIPFLSFVIPPLLQSAAIENACFITDADDKTGLDEKKMGRGKYEFITVNVREYGTKRVAMNTALLEEKSCAVNMLYTYATELTEGFFPFVEQTAQTLVPCVKYAFNETVRIAAVAALPALLKSAKMGLMKSESNEKKREEAIRGLFDYMWPSYLDCITQELHLDNLCGIIESLADAIDTLPIKMRAKQIDEINKKIAELIAESLGRMKQREMQRKNNADHDEAEEEELNAQNDSEDEFFGYIYILIAKLVKTNKTDYLLNFNAVLYNIFNAMIGHESENLVCTGICVLAQIIDTIHPPTELTIQWCDPVFKMAMKHITNENNDLRQSALFAVGAVAQALKQQFAPVKSDTLHRIVAIVDEEESREEENCPATDNGISAIGKIFMNCTQSFNQQYVANSVDSLPFLMNKWLNYLPCLGGDEEEEQKIHALFTHLVQSNNPFIFGEKNANLPKIISVFASILDCPSISEETQQQAISIVKTFRSSLPAAQWSAIVNSLTEEQEKTLNQHLTA